MSKSLIVVTGASTGIGSVIAKVFSEAGFPIALLARNLDAMLELNLPNSLSQSVDVTDFDAMKNAIKSAESKFGPVDCIINNAGFLKAGDFTEVSHSDHKKMVDVNITGVLSGIEAVLPGMRERKSGTIINISSLADRSSRPNFPTYAATKAAIKSLTESLRMANAKYGIRVCNLAPAKVKTQMILSTYLNDDQIIDAEDIAKAALWIYQQPQKICIRDVVFAPTYYEA